MGWAARGVCGGWRFEVRLVRVGRYIAMKYVVCRAGTMGDKDISRRFV